MAVGHHCQGLVEPDLIPSPPHPRVALLQRLVLETTQSHEFQHQQHMLVYVSHPQEPGDSCDGVTQCNLAQPQLGQILGRNEAKDARSLSLSLYLSNKSRKISKHLKTGFVFVPNYLEIRAFFHNLLFSSNMTQFVTRSRITNHRVKFRHFYWQNPDGLMEG